MTKDLEDQARELLEEMEEISRRIKEHKERILEDLDLDGVADEM